jgi:hypothetical protein
MLVTWKSLTELSTPTKSMVRGLVKSELVHHTDTPSTSFMGNNWLASHDAYIFGAWDATFEAVCWAKSREVTSRSETLISIIFQTFSKDLCPIFASFVSIKFCSNQQITRFIDHLCDLWTIWGSVSREHWAIFYRRLSKLMQ